LENIYLENGQLENGQLENRHLEIDIWKMKKYSTWFSPEELSSFWSFSKKLLKTNIMAESVRLSWK